MKLYLIFTLFLVLFGAMTGVSAQRACICTADYTPVCGTNRVTYSNRCRLNCAGAKFAHKGPC